ncbi:hypothetical protein [Aeromicrobium sp.]|uniref:hypothetical protein n=1 Tax=Aeromicrobium sp. TaxID=1871063 RepID=UPI0030C33F86
MLTSILPGLRDLRTPLAVGYVTLASIWLLCRDSLQAASQVKDSLTFDVQRLFDDLGPATGIAALTFAAYLVGCVLAVASPPRWLDSRLNSLSPYASGESPTVGHKPVRWYSLWRRFTARVLTYLAPPLPNSTRAGEFRRVIAQWARESHAGGMTATVVHNTENAPDQFRMQLGGFISRSPEANKERDNTDFTEAESRQWSEHSIARILTRSLIDELPDLTRNLELEQPTIFATYDRLRGEAEFRLAVSVPLLALIVVLGFSEHLWILSLLVIPPIIYVQGLARTYAAQTLVWSAMIRGLVKPPAALALDDLVAARSQD